MYGISVFLGEELTDETQTYIEEMSRIGFEGIFTSLHIPEDNAALYKKRLEKLGEITQKFKLKLMVDISGDAVKQAGLSFERLDEILAIGVTGLRMDYAISNQKIAEASQFLDIGLNASTITAKDVDELKSFKANFTNIEAWHNYYPRPETGLSSQFFIEKNNWLKQSGFQVFAFVPGNNHLRGPLFEGLPTLEKHRYDNPFSAALDLKENYQIDGVYLGDPMIKGRTKRQFEEYVNHQIISLEVIDIGSDYYSFILGEHNNRQDDARDVIRSANARFKKIETINPETLVERKLGSVTIDNLHYGRYMGEIQVTKKDLPAYEKVNVAAQIVLEDCSLLKLIRAGRVFKLIEKGTL
ncbi:DUF871 domain-containing protein [Candidatus Enterococcus ikei]|uniref:DUF871 domain-containing protein n=1 Tax=Candidatus Enterococcus ikei TaxID=2815326 RepID=A0ABS3H330_9ENTE|nr:MupG family TIM beta-alpha barrel fold protein [Enterococcus sp. DIV0869a]MBO0441926.1 DUF871 domain-containing protein [Enterococcus sp. DIV0869a]